jgi:hypothetical protein
VRFSIDLVTSGASTDARPRSPLTYRGRRAAAIVAAILLCTSVARAQDVSEPSLKAAFIFNFAKFTEWPSDVRPATAPFNACVLGDDAVGEALARSVNGRMLADRRVIVSRITIDGTLRSCQLLYLSSVAAAQVAVVINAVRGAPVLTISDADDFARLGGIAQLFVENGRTRFNFNLEEARQSHLQLSSKLLALAAHVIDAAAKGSRQ